MAHALAQTPYPDFTIQDVAWTEGTHHTSVSNRILSPSGPDLPVEITETADAEFVSGTQVRLRPGFHAGGFEGGGRFRARIDEGLGTAPDLIVIHPEPSASYMANVLHVPKWEKLEMGLRLPQAYQDAVDRFFAHYYSNPNDVYQATPGAVDADHDLNPYADDSLQLVLTLNDPDNTTRLKWGFYMKEGKWTSEFDNAVLVLDPLNPLHPYGVRFRLAPDKEGPWQFSLMLKAPYTSDLANGPLPDLISTGYGFVCDPRLEDNKGPLSVNHANGRTLKTATGQHFMALGTNIGPERGSPSTAPVTGFFQRFGIDQVKKSMTELHEVGGNFMRIWLSDKVFSPENVNLGVYDAYRVPFMCAWDDVPGNPGCSYLGDIINDPGHGQLQALAFDEVLDHARATNIYFQVCVDPYPVIVAYEKNGWGANPYLVNFLEPYRFALDNPNNNPLNLRRLFYQDGDTSNTTEGPFYFWKRRYKYMLNRWGYAPHFAIIEPFQEIGQILSYNTDTICTNEPLVCGQANQDAFCRDMCHENRGIWEKDAELPYVIAQWTKDMIGHVRGAAEPGNPASPLGEDKKLFLISIGGGPWLDDPNPDTTEIARYNRPFTIPELDLIDVHLGFFDKYRLDKGKPTSRNHEGYMETQAFWSRFPTPNAPLAQRKPFNHGEFTHYTGFSQPGWSDLVEDIFHNYNVSFHNELWSSAFSGKFAAGTSWLWERVFWWPRSLKEPPMDPNQAQQGTRSAEPGALNKLGFAVFPPIYIKNRPVHQHFQPLADLLNHPSWQALNFFDNELSVGAVYDLAEANPSLLECYYLKSDGGDAAIGWVHNRKSSSMSNFYIAVHDTMQNFFGCETPMDTALMLPGLIPDTEYHITWFPTWVNSTVCPLDTVWSSNSAGELLLDLSTAPFGDTIRWYTDTLHADYAFIITLDDFVKSRSVDDIEPLAAEVDWDFILFPNPTRHDLFLRFSDDTPKEIILYDISGRAIVRHVGISARTHHLGTSELAKAPYFVQVSCGARSRIKKLIIH